MLDRGHNLHDPRYIGHQVPAPVPLAGLFDAVGSVTNQPMAIYDMGPWATAAEFALVERLGERIGWRAASSPGWSRTAVRWPISPALLTAQRDAQGVWQHGVALVGAGVACRPAGGTPALRCWWSMPTPTTASPARPACSAWAPNQVLRVGLDAQRRMDPQQLDDMLADLRAKRQPIVAVVGCACSTPIGAFDRLDDVADVCRGTACGCTSMRPTAARPVSASGTGTWWPGWSGPTASSGTRTRCSSCRPCARSCSIGRPRTSSRPFSRTPRTCSIRRRRAGRVRQRPAHGGMHQAGGRLRPVGHLVAARAATVGRPGRRDLRPGPHVLREAGRRGRFRPAARAAVQHRGLPPRAREAPRRPARRARPLPVRVAAAGDRVGRVLHRLHEARRPRRAPRDDHQSR